MRTPRLPVVDWTDAPADLNGLVRFAERRNVVSARVPSHFKRGLRSVRERVIRTIASLVMQLKILEGDRCSDKDRPFIPYGCVYSKISVTAKETESNTFCTDV